HGRDDPRPQGSAAASGDERRHDSRPRPVRRAPAGRATGRRARRGDGLRGAPRPDIPARGDDLADRADHQGPRDRHPRSRGARRRSVLSPDGGRVHAAWGLALSRRIRDELELEADAIWSDDGIAVHLPDADEPPPADLVLIEPDEVEDLVVAELAGSALFGAR